jgi:hypothetical protein
MIDGREGACACAIEAGGGEREIKANTEVSLKKKKKKENRASIIATNIMGSRIVPMESFAIPPEERD